jgi:hypothetical protein
MKLATLIIRKILTEHKAIIEYADKGKYTVVLNKQAYHEKIMEIIKSNEFSTLIKIPQPHSNMCQKCSKY